MTGRENVALELWSDEPSAVDLLAFAAVAETVVDAVLDDALDPVALGVSGSWGSGKTTVLRLVEIAVSRPPKEGEGKVLAVPTDPWRHDPTVGAKESLIAGVLDALQKEIIDTRGPAAEALGLLRRLARRVDWAKAIKVAAKASLAFQLPSVNDITDLIRTEPDDGGESEPRGLEAFREEFSTLMASEDLGHVRRVVVLVDDLDRCLPDTVVETLETIRLFLAVPKMAFVIAADEERVAEAIRQRYPGGSGDDPEEPAKLYLHKIVQTTIPLPSLSRFDTEAYLLLLQLGNRLPAEQLEAFVDQCGTLRLRSAALDDLTGVDGVSIAEELTFAARLTPMLYEKLRGNPRRIKRFLNDLRVRQSIAKRRGIALAPDVVAKLMVLEVLLGDEFTKSSTGWRPAISVPKCNDSRWPQEGRRPTTRPPQINPKPGVPRTIMRRPAGASLTICSGGRSCHPSFGPSTWPPTCISQLPYPASNFSTPACPADFATSRRTSRPACGPSRSRCPTTTWRA